MLTLVYVKLRRFKNFRIAGVSCSEEAEDMFLNNSNHTISVTIMA